MQIQKCDWCKDGYLVVKKSSNGAILGCTNYKSDGTGCNRMMAPEYYHRWMTTVFEDDLSTDKPSYQKEIVLEIPRVKQSKETSKPAERRETQVHTIKYSEKYIEQDGFQIVADDEGKIITDMELLAKLRALRSKIMREENRPAYKIIGNKGLVSLATYRPTTKEEFISLYGLGETTYNSYGTRFIQAIIEFYK